MTIFKKKTFYIIIEIFKLKTNGFVSGMRII